MSDPVTFAGIGGVNLLANLEDAKKTWHLTSAGVIEPSGSSLSGTLLICADKTRGVAYFPTDTLTEVWFVSGAKTDRGVGIGSTRSDLKRAYGQALHAYPDSSTSLFVDGPKQARHVAGARFPTHYTPEIGFAVGPNATSKVVLVGLGTRQDMGPPFDVVSDPPDGNYWDGDSGFDTPPFAVYC